MNEEPTNPHFIKGIEKLARAVTQSMNNVHSDKFESKVDPYFTSKSKEKESGRKCSIKIFGQWT